MTLSSLKYVKLNNLNIDLSHFPNFLVIGPQRTGTTWLYKNLIRHPEVFMSKEKEIHFFNMLNKTQHVKYRSADLGWYLKFFYDTPLSYVQKYLSCYLRYQKVYKPKIRGEACASYAAMEEDLVSEVITLNPEIKIILMIRDPLQRAWSHAKKDLVKRRRLQSINEVSEDEIEYFLKDPYQVACGKYTMAIDKWSTQLQDGNLFIGLFDEIIHAPKELLKKIFIFLGLDYDAAYVQAAEVQVNTTSTDTLPLQYSKMLYAIFQDELEELNSRYGFHWD